MYELPEVETIRRDLDRELVGKKVKTVTAESMRCLARYKNRKSFTSQFDQPKIARVSRVGLYITIALDNDSLVVVSLGSTGSLRRNTNREAVQEGTEVVITFTQHGQLRLIDREGTAEIFIVDADSLAAEVPEIEIRGRSRGIAVNTAVCPLRANSGCQRRPQNRIRFPTETGHQKPNCPVIT